MTVNTSYGTWSNRVNPDAASFKEDLAEALGDFGDEYDTEEIAAEYRRAINDALPPGVSLNGSEFYGPYYRDEVNLDGYPTDEYGRLDIGAVVADIDFDAIRERNER